MTEIRAQENAIILAASNQVVTLGSQMGQNMLDGKETKTQYADLKKLNILLKSYQYKADYTDQQIDSLLYALKKLSKASDFPVVSPLVGKELTVYGYTIPKYQYSIDGVSWHEVFSVPDTYLRISVDNAASWSAAIKFVGTDGADAPETQFQYSVDGSTLWHSPFVNGDLYLRTSTDGGSTWSSAILFIGNSPFTIVDIPIPLWNMDTDDSKQCPHGLDAHLDSFRVLAVTIFAGGQRLPLYQFGNISQVIEGGVSGAFQPDAFGGISLVRRVGGSFDDPAFNAATGAITLMYQ